MSEFRNGRRRFISREPLKEEKWNAEYDSRTRRTTHNKDVGTAILQPNFFPWLTSEPQLPPPLHVTSSANSLPPQRPSSPNRRRSEYFTFQLPSNSYCNSDRPVARSRDRSTLREVTTKTKLRSANDSKMTPETGFRPIHKHHSDSSGSSSDCERVSLNNHSNSLKSHSLTAPKRDVQLSSTDSVALVSSSGPKTVVGQRGTLLTLPANADSMQVQIKDTKISITRIPEVSSLDLVATRRLSADYDNCMDSDGASMKTGQSICSTKIVPVPASSVFRGYDHPTQRSPVRGLRLVPSPNSAFTKTKSTKVSEEPWKNKFQSNYVHPVSKTSGHDTFFDTSELVAKTEFSLFDDSVLGQNPIDFAQILSGFWMRPADTEKPRSFKAQKSCSLDNLSSDGISKDKSTKKESKQTFKRSQQYPQSFLSKNTEDHLELPISRTIVKSESFISQLNRPISKVNESKLGNVLVETDSQSQRQIPNDTSDSLKSKPNLFVNQKSVVLESNKTDPDKPPTRSFVLNPVTSKVTNPGSDPHTITDALSHSFISTLEQPIGFDGSWQSVHGNSYGLTSTSMVRTDIQEAISTNSKEPSKTDSITSSAKANAATTYILPTSQLSSLSAAPTLPPSEESGSLYERTMSESSITSAMHSLEKAISMLNSVAMDTNTPGSAVTLLTTIATDTEALAKSFHLGKGARDLATKTTDVVGPGCDGGGTSRMLEGEITTARLPLDDREAVMDNPVRQDAFLSVTLNLLDQTLAEIHQEFPPGKAVETRARSKTSRAGSKELRRPEKNPPEVEVVTPFWDAPWNTSSLRQAVCQSRDAKFTAMSMNTSGSDRKCEMADLEEQVSKRILDRQDSFNRPGSALHMEPLPLPKDSVIQRYRRKKKNKSSASPSSSSLNSSSSSSGDEVGADGNSTSIAKRPLRSAHRPQRRQNLSKKPEESGGILAAKSFSIDDYVETRTTCGEKREEHADPPQNTNSEALRDKNGEAQSPFKFTQGKIENPKSLEDGSSVNITSGLTPKETIEGLTEHTDLEAQATELPQEWEGQALRSFPLGGDSVDNDRQDNDNKINNNDNRSFETGDPKESLVFRNLEEEEDESEEEFHDSHSRLSSVSLSRVSVSSPPSAVHSSASVTRLRTSGHSSPVEAIKRTETEAPPSPLGHPDSSWVLEREKDSKELRKLDEESLDSPDEVFLSPLNQLEQPPGVQTSKDKADSDSVPPTKEPSRTVLCSKELVVSGAHGCDYRAESNDSNAHQMASQGGSELGEGNMFTGSAQITLRQSQDQKGLIHQGSVKGTSKRLIHLCSRSTSSGDNDDTRATTTTTTIQTQSRAVPHEAISLKAQEETGEVPKIIHTITPSHAPCHVSHTRATLPEAKKEEQIEALDSRYRVSQVSLRPSIISSASASHGEFVNSVQVKAAETKKNLDSREEHYKLKTTPQELVVELNVLPGSIPGVKAAVGTCFRGPSNEPKGSERFDSRRSVLNSTLNEASLSKSEAKHERSEALHRGAHEQSSEAGFSTHVNIVVPTASAKEPKRRHLFDNESKSDNNKFIMGTVFTDRKKSKSESNSGEIESLPSENTRRTQEAKTSIAYKSLPMAGTFQLIQSTVKHINEGDTRLGGVTGKENMVTPTQVREKTKLSRADSDGPQSSSVPQATSRLSSQFLGTLSKFSQPSTSTVASFSAPRVNPASVSRVSWAKQRFGDGPQNSTNSQNVALRQSFPGTAYEKSHRCPSLKSNTTTPSESGSGNKSTVTSAADVVFSSSSSLPVVEVESCDPCKKTVNLFRVSSETDQEPVKSVDEHDTNENFSEKKQILVSEGSGLIKREACTQNQHQRSLDSNDAFELEQEKMGLSGVDRFSRNSSGSGKIKQYCSKGNIPSDLKLSGAKDTSNPAFGSTTENPEISTSNRSTLDSKAEGSSTFSPANLAPESFTSSCIETSRASDSTQNATDTKASTTNTSGLTLDQKWSNSICRDASTSSQESQSVHLSNVPVSSQTPQSVASFNATMSPNPTTEVISTKETVKEIEAHLRKNEEDNDEMTKEDLTSATKIDAENSEKSSTLSTMSFQEKSSILRTKNSKQEPVPSAREDANEAEGASFVELSLDKAEDSGSESSRGSMQILSDEDEPVISESHFPTKNSETLPSESSNSRAFKDLGETASAGNRHTTVRFKEQLSMVSEDPQDKDSSCSSSLEPQTSPSILKKNLAKPCIVRKQLVQLDSALHPSSCNPPESKPVEARWSPKLVRKLNLAEAQNIDVSDLNVDPDLLDFLSSQIDRATVEKSSEPPRGDEDKRSQPPTTLSNPSAAMMFVSDKGETPSSSAASVEAEKPEAEVGKRKFFSALKTNSASLRAKARSGGGLGSFVENSSSQDKNPFDRLTSFAIISDVGIGAKRRHFQKVDSSSDANVVCESSKRQTTSDYSDHKKDHSKTDTFSSVSHFNSGLDSGYPGVPLPAPQKVSAGTRLGRNEEPKTRRRRPEMDSDEDFDRLVEINFRQLVEEGSTEPEPPAVQPTNRTRTKCSTSFARSISTDRGGASSDRSKSSVLQTGSDCPSGGTRAMNASSGSSLDDKNTILREKLKAGGESTLRSHSSRRQMPRFKTQPVTFDEVEKAFETALNEKESKK